MSVDPPAVSRRLKQRLESRFTFLADPEGVLLDGLGIRHRGGRNDGVDIAYPTAVLVDAGGLEYGTLIPLDVPQTEAEELKVVVSSPQWLLRPGQLVPVLLAQEAPKPGLYVPMDAILPLGPDRGALFLEVDGTVRRVEVRLLDRVRYYQRVEGEGVAAGARVITDYIHFLQDGERVKVVRTREMKS